MRILVTGSRGYLGAEMVPALLAAGHQVEGLDVGFFDGCDFGGPPEAIPDLGVDLRDVEAGQLEGFDAVIHLGALSNDPLGDLDANLTHEINLHATVRLAEAARRADVSRFLFASSCSLYGAGGGGALDERSSFHPVTPYGASKVGAEQALAALADDSFSPVYLRNATVYGVSRRLRADIVVNDLVGHAVTTGRVLMQSDGSPWRPLVHVSDVIDAFAACLVAPRDAVHDQAFNVGRNGENYQIRDIAALVADVVPGSEVAFAGGATSDARNYRVDFTKIAGDLPGFTARWTLRRGIEELYEAYAHHGLTVEEWSSSRYWRLRTITSLREAGLLDDQLRFTASRR